MSAATDSTRDIATRQQLLWGRPMLAAIALMNAITGLTAAFVLAPLSFGLDADAFRRGAIAATQGQYDKDFLYSPLAALVAQPLTLMPSMAAALFMTAIGLVVLLIGVTIETTGQATVDRVLVAVAALFFLPVVNELLLGQVTLLVAAALYPVVRSADRVRNGIPLGIALALAPKPVLALVLVWMLVRRRRSLVGCLAAALMGTVVGMVVMGPGLYGKWFATLTATGQVARNGNLSLWSGTGVEPVAVVIAAAITLASLWTIARSEARGLVAALLAGLLLAPYTLLYSASILLIAVRPASGFAPRATRMLALVANPAMLVAFGAWAVAALVWTLPVDWQGIRSRVRPT